MPLHKRGLGHTPKLQTSPKGHAGPHPESQCNKIPFGVLDHPPIIQPVGGWSRAAQRYLTGDVIDAVTAREWDLVSEIYPDDQLMDQPSISW